MRFVYNANAMKVVKKQTNATDCIVCGTENPNGVHASFYEMEDGSLRALFHFDAKHQSYPERTHGGLIAGIIDESIGRAIWIKKPGAYACTLKLNIEYHKGVPYGVPLVCKAYIDHVDNICFKGHAEICNEKGEMLAKGTALYMFLTLKQISPEEDVKEEDINVFVPDNVTEID